MSQKPTHPRMIKTIILVIAMLAITLGCSLSDRATSMIERQTAATQTPACPACPPCPQQTPAAGNLEQPPQCPPPPSSNPPAVNPPQNPPQNPPPSNPPQVFLVVCRPGTLGQISRDLLEEQARNEPHGFIESCSIPANQLVLTHSGIWKPDNRHLAQLGTPGDQVTSMGVYYAGWWNIRP